MPPAKKRKIQASASTVLDRTTFPSGPSIRKLLNRQTKGSLVDLALSWLDDPNGRPAKRRPNIRDEGEDSEDEEDEDEDEDDVGEVLDLKELRDIYDSDMRTKGVGRAKVVERIITDWRDGLNLRQIAQLDVQLLKDKPDSKQWIAYRLDYGTSRPVPRLFGSALKDRFGSAFTAFHRHHLYVDSTDSITYMRILLLAAPSARSSTSSAIPDPTSHPINIIHFPSTPFFLLPAAIPTSPTLRPILLQALCTTFFSASSVSPLPLRGRNILGLREMLVERDSAGRWKKFRVGKGEDGGALAPSEKKKSREAMRDDRGDDYIVGGGKEEKEMIKMDDVDLKKGRDKEVGVVWGREELPVIERLEYEIDLPLLPQALAPDVLTPPFQLRFEGPNVLSGLRKAVEVGLAEGEGRMPGWLAEVSGLGINMVKVGEDWEKKLGL